MAKFRKKPVEVEALLFDGSKEGLANALCFCPQLLFLGEAYAIKTLEGIMYLSPGDYIIRGIAGEFYPCKPDIFLAAYEPVNLVIFSEESSDAEQ